jgi:hypothetical protein
VNLDWLLACFFVCFSAFVVRSTHVVQVSFIAINAEPTSDVPAATIAHELVTLLRDSAVEFVGVIGAAHLPTVATGKMFCCSPCTVDDGSEVVPGIIKGASPLPGASSGPFATDFYFQVWCALQCLFYSTIQSQKFNLLTLITWLTLSNSGDIANAWHTTGCKCSSQAVDMLNTELNAFQCKMEAHACKRVSSRQRCFHAEGTELKDTMLSSLYFWLQSAGILSSLCLIRGHRAAGFETSRTVDSTAFGDLLNVPNAVAGVVLDSNLLMSSKLLTAGPTQAVKVDSLMYMWVHVSNGQ